MKTAVVTLPGLNRDRDMFAALHQITGQRPLAVWQTETEIPAVDLIVIGSRGLGSIEGFLLGSVSHKVSGIADCPVLLV